MKKNLLYFIITSFFCLAVTISVKSQTDSAKWALSASTTVTSASVGNVTGADQSLSSWLSIANYTGTPILQRIRINTTYTGQSAAGWPALTTNELSDVYTDFPVSPSAGYDFHVNTISLQIIGGGTGNMKANIYISTDPTFVNRTAIFQSAAGLGQTTLTTANYIKVTGLDTIVKNGKTFYVRVYPWFDNGATASTSRYICIQNLAIIGTTITSGSVSAPSAPNATAASIITTTGFTANWDAAATATGYRFDVATDNAFASMVAGLSDIDVANVTTYNVTGLTAGTTYYYRVRAYNAGGTSASSSNVITVSTTGASVPVTGITVTGAGSATTITTNGGTLQMSAAITPADATNQDVTWDVTNGTGQATISASGLLTASKDGTVTVKATAADGSGIMGTLEVTISGQVSSSKKRVGYFTFVKTMDGTATTVQTDPVYLMLQADPNLDVTLNALTDVTTAATVDQSLYDVLVIQESFAGAAAILTPAGALGLAKLTKPTLYNKSYAFAKGRAFQANSTGGGAETQGSNTLESTLVSIKVDPAVQSHDLFKDITFVGDSVGLFTSGATDPGATTGGTGAAYKAINYATNVVLSNPNTLLAKPVTVKTADQTILTVSFNDLPSGTVIGGTADQTVLGETLQTRVITVGMNFGAICATGGNNINANGLKIFKNAVYSLAGLYSTTTIPVTGITVTGAGSATTITTNGGTLQMSADVAPSDATNKSVTWSVTNGTGEATVNTSGLLTASKDGIVTVKATAADGSGVMGTLDITISGQITNIPVTGVAVTGTGAATTITTNGGTLQMVATITPTDATNKNVTWSVTNGTGQATIDATTGILTASKDGTVTVRATSTDVTTIYGELVITISGQLVTVTGVTVTGTGGATTITTNGGTLQMVATIAPTDATNKNVTWSVTNGTTGQATINTSGLLTASKNGTVTVRATSADVTTIYGELVVTISGQGTGINIVNGKGLEIYPNPVLDAITMDGASAVKKFEVISLSGKIIVQGVNSDDKLSINVSNLASGIYLLKVYTAEGIQQVKFMKK